MKSLAVEYILKKLKTPNPVLTYTRIDKFSDILNTFTYNNFINKYGGSKIPPKIDINKVKILEDNSEDDVKEFVIKFNSINYVFNTYHDNESVYYKLYQQNNKNIVKHECIFIIINKTNNTSELHNISYDEKCMPHAEMKDKKGGTLIKIALKLINKIKDNYQIKYVQLSDNSVKYCKNKHQIDLSMMMTLITGTTWYGKYGFIPKNKNLQIIFKRNKIVMDNLYLKDVKNMEKYIIYGWKKSKSTLPISKILDNYKYALNKNYKLKEFLSKFLLDYDNTCDIFYYFYEKIFEEIGLTYIGKNVYILKL